MWIGVRDRGFQVYELQRGSDTFLQILFFDPALMIQDRILEVVTNGHDGIEDIHGALRDVADLLPAKLPKLSGGDIQHGAILKGNLIGACNGCGG